MDCDHSKVETHVTEIDKLVVCSECCPYCILKISHVNIADRGKLDHWVSKK
jgi:hypothetical protein